MKNWKTTAGGILSSVGTALTGYAATVQGEPDWILLAGTIMTAIGVGLIGFKAADASKSNDGINGPKGTGGI